MQDRGLSSSAINLRKSAVSSFCNYIENIVADDMEECRNFRNFTRGMPKVNKTQVYDKIPISKEEYDKIMNYLEERKNYLGLGLQPHSILVADALRLFSLRQRFSIILLRKVRIMSLATL